MDDEADELLGPGDEQTQQMVDHLAQEDEHSAGLLTDEHSTPVEHWAVEDDRPAYAHGPSVHLTCPQLID